MRWARVPPELGLASLKPYLFVIKDKKNYLGEAAPLTPKQAALFNRLLAGEASAAAAQQEIKKLAHADITAIFGALRQIALASTSFDQKPPAMYGLENMAQAVPDLEGQYLDVLHALPAKRLGPWAVIGHAATVKSANGKARLATIVEHWGNNGGPLVKRAIAQRGQAPRRDKGV
jgi:hypothetical protein